MTPRAALTAATALLASLVGGHAVGDAASDPDPLLAAAGKALFERNWVAAPASVAASDGLGPLYNARGCAACHPGGAGIALGQVETAPIGLVLRLSAGDGPDPAAPHPVYGGQFQTQGLAGIPAEGRLSLDWELHDVTLSGGEVVELRHPVARVDRLGYGPLGPALTSLRIAPPLFGLAEIDAIPEAAILALADPEDSDGDGISGRPNRDTAGALGRFGWKADAASLREQAAMAASQDVGLSSALFPEGWGDCTEAEAACRAAPDGAGPEGHELEGPTLDLILAYLGSLPPPAPGPGAGSDEARRGAAIFTETGCSGCHVPALPDASGGELRPYSDFLLHDMGEGLADGRPEVLAGGGEWRTAPLWGMGDRRSGPQATYLHDGRARSPLEAILWHGGEAMQMRDAVVSMDPGDRAALLRFLETL